MGQIYIFFPNNTFPILLKMNFLFYPTKLLFQYFIFNY